MTGFSAKDEISSTEKLLDVIRGGSTGAELAAVPASSRIKTAQGFLQRVPFVQKRKCVGVEIGDNGLTLVKIAQLSESRSRLLNYRTLPYVSNVPRHSSDFHEFLRSSLIDFCGSLRGVEIWAVISTTLVDVRQIRIPKVAKKELFNAVFWTAKREMNFDEKESVFDFESQGEVIEDGVAKTRVMTYTAPRETVKEIRALFIKSGIHLDGLTTTAFAIQNLFRSNWVPTSDVTTYANLYLSDAYSRIAVFSQGDLILTREIKTGVDSLIISLVESFNEAKGGLTKEAAGDQGTVPPSLDALEERLDALEVNWERARERLFDLDDGPNGSRDGVADRQDDEEIVEMVGPALERLIRQVERTFEYHSRLARGDPVQRIFITGAVNIRGSIIEHISRSLGIRTEVMDPLHPSHPFLTDVTPPASVSERALYTSTLGLALSSNARTPNLLFTFDDKEKQAAIARINRSIFIIFMAIMLALTGVYVWQEYSSSQNGAAISKLKEELARYTPAAERSVLVQIAAKVKNKEQMLKGQANEVLGIAVLSELAVLTPPNVRLVGVTVDLGGIPEPQAKAATPAQPKTLSKSLVIDGIVRGDSQTLEASLVRYVMRLGASPIFINPTVHSSSLETYQGLGEVLHFILKMGLV
jgi:Tfp pilus assembly PilM family ATPase